MLRLNSETRTYDVPIKIKDETTIFVLKSMSIAARQDMLNRVTDMKDSDKSFDILLDILAERIVSIKGYDEEPLVILRQLEFVDDLTEISKSIINFASLSEAEVRNLSSSSGHSTADSATATAANVVQAEGGHASTTPTKTAQ